MIAKYTKKMIELAAFCGLVMTSSVNADVTNLVVNGGFETGDFTGWTEDSAGAGNWFVYDAAGTPRGFFPPPQGTYAALTVEWALGSMILYQDITVPAEGSWILQYIYYYNNEAGEFLSPPTLDYTGDPNQQARIDIMNPASPVDSVALEDVWQNLLQTQPGDPLILDPTTVTFDLTSFAGRTIRLRFAVTDNENVFLFGIDAVAAFPVLTLSGKVIKNQFLAETDRIHHLEWKAFPETVSYNVLRNGELIGNVLSGEALEFNDHNRSSEQLDTYTIIAFDANGIQNSSTVITLQ